MGGANQVPDGHVILVKIAALEIGESSSSPTTLLPCLEDHDEVLYDLLMWGAGTVKINVRR